MHDTCATGGGTSMFCQPGWPLPRRMLWEQAGPGLPVSCSSHMQAVLALMHIIMCSAAASEVLLPGSGAIRITGDASHT